MIPIKQTKKGNPEKYGDYAYDICFRSITENITVPVVKVGTSQATNYTVRDTKENREKLELFHRQVHGSREEIKDSLGISLDASPGKFVMGNIGKPTQLGDKVTFNLQTVHMVKGAPEKAYSFMGVEDTPCAVFTSGKQLRTVVWNNLSQKVSEQEYPEFHYSLQQYFKGTDATKISWQKLVPSSAKKEFAKYLGELIVGLSVLENAQNLTGFPSPGKQVKEFVVPLQDSFPVIDSVLIMKDNTTIPISSKSGQGAAASFFTGIFSNIMKNPSLLGSNDSYLKKIREYAVNIGMLGNSKLKSKELVYEIGVRDLLKVPKTMVSDSFSVFQEFKKAGHGKYDDPGIQETYNRLVKKMEEQHDATAEKSLDVSTTVFFCKNIASSLQNDPESMKIMYNILGGKGYYQANMNLPKLEKGNIEISFVAAGKAKLLLVGNKSPYTDIDAQNGLVNYVLKKEG